MLITHSWLSGWRRAGCTQAQGHYVPLFVLYLCSFLPVPTLRKPTLHLSLPSLLVTLRLPLPAVLLLFLLLIYSCCSLSFLFCYTSSMRNNGRNNRPSGPQLWVCLCCMLSKATLCFQKTDQKSFECLREREGGSLGSVRVTATRMCVTLQLR